MNEINNKLDLNLLRVLETIDRTGSITEAAEQLYLTQSAVSHALNRLRQHFSDPLFVRQGRGVRPTALTRSIVPGVREHLQALSAAVQLGHTFSPASLDCTFRLGFRDALESVVFPKLLPHLHEQAPGIRVVSKRVEPGALAKELTADQLDLVVELAQPFERPIRSEAMYREKVVVVMRKGHPAAEGLTVQAYAQAKHVMVSLRTSGPEVLDNLLVDHGIERDIILRCQHYFAACQVISATDWLLLMPSTYAVELSRVLPIVTQPLPVPVQPLEVRMYWHESVQADPANRWLRKMAMRLAKLTDQPD